MIVQRLGVAEDEAIESGVVTLSKQIENAQKKVEGTQLRSIRKYVLQYDDVMNTRREVIYEPAPRGARSAWILTRIDSGDDGRDLSARYRARSSSEIDSQSADGVGLSSGLGKYVSAPDLTASARHAARRWRNLQRFGRREGMVKQLSPAGVQATCTPSSEADDQGCRRGHARGRARWCCWARWTTAGWITSTRWIDLQRGYRPARVWPASTRRSRTPDRGLSRCSRK